ncbi:MAG: fluoride efflux transporter CrcB [Acidimicrobiales bacterium]|nr:fluoride efflux transporter CrcB [Acidimicrobiales bacterium]
MGLYVGVALAGALGAPARYLLDGLVQARFGGQFPRGTLAVNLLGSLWLGVLTGLVLYHGFPDTPRVLLGTGFCGAFTTFSTFGFETVRLAETGQRRLSGANVATSVGGSIVAAALGLALAGTW